MLPNIRAVLGAIIAAVALLTISFGLVATFRVAQETRIGLVQADIVQRGRMSALAAHEPARIVPIEQPAPLEPIPVTRVEISQAPDMIAEPPQPVAQAPETPTTLVAALVDVEPPATTPPVAETPATEPPAIRPPATEAVETERPAQITTIEQLIAEFAPAEPPMGGPLAEQNMTHPKPRPRKAAQDAAASIAKKKAEQAAARKARAQRLARERKAAARKLAAQTRAQQQPVSSFNNAPFGNSFGSFSNSAFGNGTFGSTTFGNSTPRR